MDLKNPSCDTTRAPVSQQGGVCTLPDMEAPKVTVNIDGIDVEVVSGTTILEAANQIGVKIPTLCQHPDLAIAGVCRMCVVEVEGMRTLQASCAYPVTGPLTIRTQSRRVRQARRHILDLLLRKHYGECYACVRNGVCELQSLAENTCRLLRFGHPTEPLYEVDTSSYSRSPRHEQVHSCRRCGPPLRGSAGGWRV